jgi:hypothetical protein
MRGQYQLLKNPALTKLASVKIAAIVVSLLLPSQFATANEVTASPADSLNFKPAAATTSQTISPNATPSDILNMTTVKPYQAPTNIPGQIPAQNTGKPLSWQSPYAKKANAKKDDSQNQMMQQLGQMLSGGSGNSAQKSSPTAAYADNSKTEAGFCYECQYGQHNGTSGLDMNKVSGYVNADSIKDMSEKEKCYAKYLEGALPDALRETPFAGRTHSGGQCARGVRMILSNAGMSKKGQSLGNAIEYASGRDVGVGNRGDGSLKRLGFRKLEGYTAATAPAGAVLVFGGPKSKDYMAGRVSSDGTGTTLGHVTIKGRDGYYTDGKTTNAAGMRRYLVGVYVMSACTNCNQNVKNRCEEVGGSK